MITLIVSKNVSKLSFVVVKVFKWAVKVSFVSEVRMVDLFLFLIVIHILLMLGLPLFIDVCDTNTFARDRNTVCLESLFFLMDAGKSGCEKISFTLVRLSILKDGSFTLIK